jgi:ribosome biogenesis GTPase A
MAVQWFPGHMHLTRKALADRIKNIDVVVEMLDARLPGSSSNPMLSAITSGRPSLKILNKRDLADASRTNLWLEYYRNKDGMQAISLDSSEHQSARILVNACRTLAPTRGTLDKSMRILICGIPNVGKSTLINTIKGKRAAKTGDEAGVTKTEQRIVLEDGFYLYDTPGVLWPRIIVAKSGYNLAASGAVGKNAFDDVETAYELVEYLQVHYARELELRYGIKNVAAFSSDALVDAIGRKRGALRPGAIIDTQKASEIIIHDFRMGLLGRITIETPDEFSIWLEEGERLDAERTLKKEAMLKKRNSRK